LNTGFTAPTERPPSRNRPAMAQPAPATMIGGVLEGYGPSELV
jgi:hypothetical protein